MTYQNLPHLIILPALLMLAASCATQPAVVTDSVVDDEPEAPDYWEADESIPESLSREERLFQIHIAETLPRDLWNVIGGQLGEHDALEAILEVRLEELSYLYVDYDQAVLEPDDETRVVRDYRLAQMTLNFVCENETRLPPTELTAEEWATVLEYSWRQGGAWDQLLASEFSELEYIASSGISPWDARMAEVLPIIFDNERPVAVICEDTTDFWAPQQRLSTEEFLERGCDDGIEEDCLLLQRLRESRD